MQELVFIKDRDVLTNSLLVSGKFEKLHKHVLEAIRALSRSVEISTFESMFWETTYLNEQNKNQPMYLMNRDGFALLTMRFTGKKALKFQLDFIAAFNRLEAQAIAITKPATYVEALRELADTIESKQKVELALKEAEHTIDENKPKVVFATSVMGNERLSLVREFAKSISDELFVIGEKKLFAWFRAHKYMNKKNEPYQQYVDMGLFKVTEIVVGTGGTTFTRNTTKLTGKGCVYFTKKIKESYNPSPKQKTLAL